jgi:zinc D-Ala-D-Ala carboxypeptidase
VEVISKYITIEEACKSTTAIRYGITNVPNEIQVNNMRVLCFSIYDVCCKQFKTKIPVNSFFRSEKLNKKIGGSANSQHTKGQAMDLDCDILGNPKITNSILFHFIKDNLRYDQLIWEFGNKLQPDWVHVSFSIHDNRSQTLVALKENGKTIYKTY